MPSITLKDVPEELLIRLRTAAARQRRSLNQEAIVLLEGGLAAQETAEERAQRQLAAWQSLAGGWASDGAFEDEVATLYAGRTAGRDVDL
jgi:plasmid stability protein